MTTHRLSHPDLEFQSTPKDETEMSLVLIIVDLNDLDRRDVRFSSISEDRLLEIETLARKLRKKL